MDSGSDAGERFRRVGEIFERARILPLSEREASVAASCGADLTLLAEARALLAFHEIGGDTLDRGILRPASGAMIGRYRIEGLLGEGGMGTVYRATQTEPVRREVALKLIKLGMDTRHVIRRFEAERQTLARLEHPNIARVLDGGTTPDGRPYFAMDLVQGVPINEYCDAQRLDWRDRVALIVQVSAAVQHAHQRGIVHRDLKPSNILVACADGVAVPKVIDFGVAKALDASENSATWNTVAGHAVGTPDYMSPEQADGGDVDTRTDVYALGVVLYQLLVGTTPLRVRGTSRGRSDAAAPRSPLTSELRRRLREDEPIRPSSAIAAAVTTRSKSDIATWRRAVRGDLDSIVLKALAREPSRRYSTVAAFSDDLGRMLRDEPVTARPPSTAYLVSKFAQRHTVALIAASVVVASLMIGFGVSVYGLGTARFERDAARRAEKAQARLATALSAELFASNIERGRQSVRQGSWPEANDLLWSALIADPTSPQARWAVREMVWAQGCVATLHVETDVESVRFLPGGERLFVCSVGGRPILFDIATGVSTELAGPSIGAWEVAVNRDGTIGCTSDSRGDVLAWDFSQQSLPRWVVHCGDGRACVSCSRDENVAFAGGAQGVLWRIDLDGSVPPRPISFGAPIARIVVAPDGTVAAGGTDGSVILAAPDGSQQRKLQPQQRGIQSIAFSHDGLLMATGTKGPTIAITNLSTGEIAQTLTSKLGTSRDLWFGLDDSRLLVLGWWRLAEVDLLTEAVRPLVFIPAWRIDVLPDGSAIALAGGGTRSASVWRVGTDAAALRDSLPPHLVARPIAGSADSAGLAFIASDDTGVLGLDEHGQTLWTLPSAKPRTINSNDDGSLFATLTTDRRACVYRTSDRSLVAEGRNARLGEAPTLAFQGSDLFAYVTRDDAVRVIDLKTGEECEALPPSPTEVLAVAFSPDGSLLSACARQFAGTMIDLASGQQTLEISLSTGFATAFSQGGDYRLIGTWRGDLLVRNVLTGESRTLRGHSARVVGIIPHPRDPNLMLSESSDGSVRLWHLGLGREVLALSPFAPPSALRTAGFLGDGDRIAMTGTEGELAIYSISVVDRIIERMLAEERERLQGNVPTESDEP